MLETISSRPKTWTEILKETQLSRPVVSQHVKSLLADGLIAQLPSQSKRGTRYDITPKGRESVLQEQDRKYIDQSPFFRAFDLDADVEVPSPIEISTPSHALWIWDEVGHQLPAPEEIVRDYHPVFPLPIRAVLRLSERATYAIEPWLQRMRRKYGIREGDDGEEDWLYEEMAYHFADPTIKKLCEVLFERTRVLCSLHSEGKKGFLPTLDNILNFNFEFICRYEGENLLSLAARDQRTKAQHVLAGILMLYLAGSGKGPIETFVWTKQELEALVESKLLTQEEIQPLLEACKLVNFSNPPREGDSEVQLCEEDLTDEQKRNITMFAYRRFYFAGLFDKSKGFPKVSWEERLQLLPIIRIAQKLDQLAPLKKAGDHYEKEPFAKEALLTECKKSPKIPAEKLEHLVDRIVELGVIRKVREQPESFLWNYDGLT